MPTRTQIHFGIWHDELDPGFISQELGILPSTSYRKGDTIQKHTLHFRQTGFWEISSHGIVESWDINNHIGWLMEQIQKKVENVRILSTQGYKISVRICWVDRGGTSGPSLSAEHIKELAKLNAILNVDWYEAELSDKSAEHVETD